MKLRHVSLLLLLGLGACSSPPLPPDVDKAVDLLKPSKSLTAEQLKQLEIEIGDYRLGSGDVVELYCMDIPELNRRYSIGPDGKLTVPGVGVVSLDGLTREQAAKRIEEILKPTYRDPHVSLLVQEYLNNRVSVLGEVRWPGLYNFPGRTLLLDALARAQGLTAKADMHGCTVVRGNGMVIEIDLFDLLRKGDRLLNIPLLPNDAVFVRADEEHTIIVLGEVAKPGVYKLGQDEDVVRAIAEAGGETKDASLHRVQIVRRDKNGQASALEVDVDRIQYAQNVDSPPLDAGDIVWVPRKGVATFNYYLNQITPSMNTILLGTALQNMNKK
ncbi:MAG: SLBB domain-containing protein [Kiritimatiellia bacterium]